MYARLGVQYMGPIIPINPFPPTVSAVQCTTPCTPSRRSRPNCLPWFYSPFEHHAVNELVYCPQELEDQVQVVLQEPGRGVVVVCMARGVGPGAAHGPIMIPSLFVSPA